MESIPYAMSPCGKILQFNYWYSTNNYEKPLSLIQGLQESGYVLHTDYHEDTLTSFKIVGIKKRK